jgi:hypothetical protein
MDAMERQKRIRRLVLRSISDDFENVDQTILREVTRGGSELGLTIERSDVLDALAWLIAEGLAKAYLLSPAGRDPFAGEVSGMPTVDAAEEDLQTYFYITQKGKDLFRDDEVW